MTDAQKIDTQAPDTSREYIQRMIACAPFADQTAGIPEMVATLRALLAERDLADARAVAAWQGGIDALLDRVGDLPISEIAADEVIYAAKKLTSPTDPAALDRLIAERVREAVDRALRDAVAICKKVRNENAENEDQAVGALDCAVSIMDEVNRRARGSKEGRDA